MSKKILTNEIRRFAVMSLAVHQSPPEVMEAMLVRIINLFP